MEMLHKAILADHYGFRRKVNLPDVEFENVILKFQSSTNLS